MTQVSDRESLAMAPGTAARLEAAQAMVAEDRGEDILFRDPTIGSNRSSNFTIVRLPDRVVELQAVVRPPSFAPRLNCHVGSHNEAKPPKQLNKV